MSRKNELIQNKRIRKVLVERWQDIDGVVRCVSCGSSHNIEWHHAIPIEVGGQDVITNLVPACHNCHMAAHSWKECRSNKLKDREPNIRGGRHYSVPENYKDLIRDYVFCKIGKEELGRRWNDAMGIESADTPEAVEHISEKSWYRKFLDELNIKKVKNRLDMYCSKRHPANTTLREGAEIGTITYMNGTVEKIIYHDPNYEAPTKEIPEWDKIKHNQKPDGYKIALNDYVHCRIGLKELSRRLADCDHMDMPKYLAGMTCKTWYKNYLDELGIVRVVNKVDKPSAEYVRKGMLGYIVYKSGKVTDIYA